MKILIYVSVILLTNCSNYGQRIAEIEHIEGLQELIEESRKALVYLSTTSKKESYYRDENLLDHYYGGGDLSRTGEEKTSSSGCSAFFIDFKQGYLASNWHCVDGLQHLNLRLANGKSYRGQVIGSDKYTDVALLKVSDPDFDRRGLRQLTFADSSELRRGDDALILGAPLGYKETSTIGVITGFNYLLGSSWSWTTPFYRGSWGRQLQLDATVLGGNSGGPVLDATGQVIGIATWAPNDKGGQIAFAVSSNTAQHIIAQLHESPTVKWGTIGVEWQRLKIDLRQGLMVDDYPELPDHDTGAIITEVATSSPASEAGLQVGDIVFAIADQKIGNHLDAFNAVAFTKPGQTLTLKFIRNGEVKNKKVKVALWKDPADARPVAKTASHWGLKVAEIDKASRFYQVTSQDGLLVISDDAYPREHSRAGCYLLAVDQTKITGLKMFAEYLEDRDSVIIYSLCISGHSKYYGYSTLRKK